MKKKLIQYVSVLLSFLAGLFLTSYLTQVGNRDMTTSMAEAVLPVLYAETEGTLYNEMHGYRTDMDGGYMKDSVIAVQEDHVLKLALDKDNQVCGYQFLSLGKMMDAIKKGMSPNEAYEKNVGTYGRFKAEDGAVAWIDPRKQ